jgi:hypothetical protein
VSRPPVPRRDGDRRGIVASRPSMLTVARVVATPRRPIHFDRLGSLPAAAPRWARASQARRCWRIELTCATRPIWGHSLAPNPLSCFIRVLSFTRRERINRPLEKLAWERPQSRVHFLDIEPRPVPQHPAPPPRPLLELTSINDVPVPAVTLRDRDYDLHDLRRTAIATDRGASAPGQKRTSTQPTSPATPATAPECRSAQDDGGRVGDVRECCVRSR